MQLKSYCKDLEKMLLEILRTSEKIKLDEDTCQNCEFFKDLNTKLNKLILDNKNTNADETYEMNHTNNKIIMLNASTNTDDNELRLAKNNYVDELEIKCNELENCIELLKNEYEKCEDYWASKLDDERQMFEQEQHQSTEKLTELFAKIAEYEAQFAQQENAIDNRLPPIEETYNLEKQFTDLEQEYDEFRGIAEQEIFDKDNEIAVLREKLNESTTTATNKVEVAVQVDLLENIMELKMSNLSNHVIESTNLFSADTLPYNWSDNTQQSTTDLDSFNISTDVWNDKESSLNVNNTEEDSLLNSTQENNTTISMPLKVPYNLFNTPSSSEHQLQQSNNTTPCRPKRTRKYDRNPLSSQRLINKKTIQEKAINIDDKWKDVEKIPVSNKGEEQVCVVSVTMLNNLNGRVHQLERNCRYLQMVLKQHHSQAEQLLHRKCYD